MLNAGSDRENYTIRQVAEAVASIVPGARIQEEPGSDPDDARDYRVSFARIGRALPGSCSRTLLDGAREIADAVTAGTLADPGRAEYDNYQGLASALTSGRMSLMGTPRCEALYAEYEAAWATGGQSPDRSPR
jgi:hypothetical protein